MIEILNIPLKNQRLVKALTIIYGINKATALQICKKLGLNPNIKLKFFDEQQLDELKLFIEKKYFTQIGANLSREIKLNIENLITMGSYRGSRHKLKLPVRGQRTHSNAKTQKKIFFVL